MRTVLASAAVLAGAAFMFVAALGVARLPDLYTRMQSATKAATVGVAGVLGGTAVALDSAPATIRAVLIAAFFLLTSPVAAHAIARTAHARGVPLAPGTRVETGERARPAAVGGADGGPHARDRPSRPARPGDGGGAREAGGPAEEAGR